MFKMKLENWHFFLILAAIALIIKYGGFMGAVVGPYYDYASYDDFTDGSMDTSKWVAHATNTRGEISETTLTETGGSLEIHSSTAAQEVVVSKNFYGDDVAIIGKIGITCQGVGPHTGGCDIAPTDRFGISGQSCSFALTDSPPAYGHYFEDAFTIDIMSSKLNSSQAVVSLNSVKKCDLDLSVTKELKFSMSTSSGANYNGFYYADISPIFISDVLYKIPLSCELAPGELLAVESFAGPKTLTVESFRYPVSHFCIDHEVVRTGPGGSDETAEPYLDWIAGKSVSIPEDQTWSVYYIFDNSQNLVPTMCNLDQVYNLQTEGCTDITGVVQVCSEGIWDAVSGTCAVTIGATEVCEAGGVWNEDNRRCEVTLPSSGVCPENTTLNAGVCEYVPETVSICENGRFDVELLKCVFNPPIQEVCSEGTLNEETGACEIQLVLSHECSGNQEWNEETQRCEGTSNFVTTTVSAESTNVTTNEELPVKEKGWFADNWQLITLLAVIGVGLYVVFKKKKGKR